MSDTQRQLHVDGALGAEVVRAAVVGRLEGRTGVVDLRLEGEDLVAARVGEHQAMPVAEAVDAAEALDAIGAGPQHQVVRVAQDDADAEVLEVGRGDGAHRRRAFPPA